MLPDAYTPRSMPFTAWPASHRAAWQEAFRKRNLFEPVSPTAHWRPRSIAKTQKGYSVWLTWNKSRQAGPFTDKSSPARLVTRESVAAYIDDMKGISASFTVFCRIQELHDAIRVMVPLQDWSWLRNGVNRLRRNAKPSRNKRVRLRPAEEIERLGHELMAQAQFDPRLTALEAALMYRDGLMVVFLIRRPLRMRNFTSIAEGTSLFLDGETPSIAFAREDTKGKRPIEAVIPSVLRQAIECYISQYRPALLTTSRKAKRIETNALWISRDGTVLSERSLHTAIRKRTKDAFGQPIPPHWFRDACVTTLIHDAPASARISMGLLGHASPAIAERHYDQACVFESAQRAATVLEECRLAPPPLKGEQ
jgi:integrase